MTTVQIPFTILATIAMAILITLAILITGIVTPPVEYPHIPDMNTTSTIATPDPTPYIDSDPMPCSDYVRPYDIQFTYPVYRAKNGSSYIDPDHGVVQWYARNTVLNETGLYYLDGGKVYHNRYPDFAHPHEDHWMNADYYLSNGHKGDCEDYAIAIGSILEAKGVPNMLILVTDHRKIYHAYLQYYYNGTYYAASDGKIYDRVDKSFEGCKFISMFNRTTDYSTYREDWYVSLDKT